MGKGYHQARSPQFVFSKEGNNMPSSINLRHITFKQALCHARMCAGMTKEEVSEASGISMSKVSRFFQENDAYNPSPALIPALCRALGNTVLVDWLNAQIEDLREDMTITSAEDLTRAVMQATQNTGVLNAKTLAAIEDGDLSRKEAQILQAQFKANGNWNYQAADALEGLASGKIKNNGGIHHE